MKPGQQTYLFVDEEIKDLKLWSKFLTQAHGGISINGLVLQNPTQLTISDSCPVGLSGFTGFGTAWRLKVNKLSPIYGQHVANNMLEFL